MFTWMVTLFFLLLPAVTFAKAEKEDEYRKAIEERIRPIGQVRLENPNASFKAQPTAEVVKKPSQGKDIYEQYCIICHKDGVAGAPRFGVKEDWQPRLEKEKNVDGLLEVAKQGLNAMPPKGTCQSCSDEELKDAVLYMLPAS